MTNTKNNYYVCNRYRMCEWLINQGFNWVKTIPDIRRQDYVNWCFEITPELKEAVRTYFEDVLGVVYCDTLANR